MDNQTEIYLIKRYGKVLIHVGIYVNNDLIYHYASQKNCVLIGRYVVKKSTLMEFSSSRKVEYIFLQKIQLDIVERRAKEFSKVNRFYNIITNNCVTFLLYCLKGKSVSVREMLCFALHHKILLFSFLS